MDSFILQLGLALGIVVCSFAGPVIAVYFLRRRKKKARAARRSPLTEDLLRAPGHSLREQLIEASEDVIWDLAYLFVFPLLVLCLFFAQNIWRGPANMTVVGSIYVVVTLAVITHAVRKLLKAATQLDRLRAGYDAELAVGQELDQLMRKGAAVFHDVPADNFNIDHIVVSLAGVFAVETKGLTKPNRDGGKSDATVVFDGTSLRFPTWVTRKPLDQAERQATWTAKWLTSAVGSPVYVLPILALPGWFVERTGRGTVRVFSGKELHRLLTTRGTKPLSESEVQRIAYQVEQRCRTVAPHYAGAADKAR